MERGEDFEIAMNQEYILFVKSLRNQKIPKIMKRKSKLAVLMAMVMMMFVPLNAAVNDIFVYNELKYEVTSEGSDNCVKVIGRDTDPSTTIEITIPATVTYSEITYQVTEIDNGAFSNKGYITKVTLPDNCKSIGESTFKLCI